MKKVLMSPSGAHRWLNCTRAPMLEAALPGKTSEFAAAGTAGHAIGEAAWMLYLGRSTREEFDATVATQSKILTDLGEAPGEYANAISKWMDAVNLFRAGDWWHIQPEARVSLSAIRPGMKGSIDLLAAGGSIPMLLVSDLKLGRGVRVSPVENPQLMLYAYGALQGLRQLPLGDNPKVILQIAQPLIEGGINHWVTSASEILEWVGDVVRPAAQAALQGGVAKPGDWCRFCRASGVCPAQAELAAQVKDVDAKLLGLDDVAYWLTQATAIRSFLKALEDKARANIACGKKVPGWGLKPGRLTRKVVDDANAIDSLVAAGYRQSEVSERKLLSLTTLDKLVGKDRLAEVLGTNLISTQGQARLTQESADITSVAQTYFGGQR